MTATTEHRDRVEHARLAIAESLERVRAEVERHLGPLSSGPVYTELERSVLALEAAINHLRGGDPR